MVTGGAGYVGSALVPELLAQGHKVTVLDLFLYGDEFFDELRSNPDFRTVKGDLRDTDAIRDALDDCDAVIHLACISNDPSFELDPELGRSINYDAFRPLVRASKDAGVQRFIYASSSSVYGIKDEPEVTEELSRDPLTDYSKYKALCEDILHEEYEPGFVTCIVRPSTVCGYAPRLRLDLTVNILTSHAINNGKITVFGGEQKRPNIHIKDMVACYLHLLDQPDDKIDGETFNVGFDNYTVMDIAKQVRSVVGDDIEIAVTPSDDLRSYHVSSKKIANDLGFVASHSIEDAIRDLQQAFSDGKVPGAMDDERYFNLKLMQSIKMK